VTLDDSLFYLNTDHELIWLQPDAEVPERERHTVPSDTFMLTIVWHPAGFPVVDCLSRPAKFNEDYYVTHPLSPLAIWREIQVGKTDRKLIVHSDNAHPQTARRTLEFLEQNRMKRALHPPYSPDLAPGHSYLFGYKKRVLAGREFADGSDLLQAVMSMVNSIGKATLEEVFLTWMMRPAKCINTNGEYVE
jgi:hypothetical protein